MKSMRFNKELYPKIALIKAAYNYTDVAYVHLDTDEKYYYVEIKSKSPKDQVTEDDFKNEMLAQSVRHEIYMQSKNIRELLMARALATSVIADVETNEEKITDNNYDENQILKDWFESND